jgi:hypothetical protein
MLFPELTNRPHCSAAEKPEVRNLGRQPLVDSPLHQSVKPPRREAFNKAVALPADSLRGDKVEALFESRDHFQQQLRRVLQVGVHHDDCVPVRDVETSSDRRLMPEIPREPHDFDMRVAKSSGSQEPVRVVAAAIVNKDQLEIASEGLRDWCHGFQEQWQSRFLIEDWKHKGNQHKPASLPL